MLGTVLAASMNFTDGKSGAIELLKQLALQRETGAFCDLVVEVQNRTFQAHRCVLAASSAKFRTLLSLKEDGESFDDADGGEPQQGRRSGTCVQPRPWPQRVRLELDCATADSVEQFLTYLYSGSIRLDGCNVAEMLSLATEFDVGQLRGHCLTFLKQCTSVGSRALLRDIAAKYHLDELVEAVDEFERSHRAEILAESNEAMTWSQDRVEKEMAAVAKAMEVNPDPGQCDFDPCAATEHLFHFLLRWVLHDLAAREHLFKPLLSSYVNGALLSTDFISNTLSTNELFRKSNACLVGLVDFMRTSSQLDVAVDGHESRPQTSAPNHSSVPVVVVNSVPALGAAGQGPTSSLTVAGGQGTMPYTVANGQTATPLTIVRVAPVVSAGGTVGAVSSACSQANQRELATVQRQQSRHVARTTTLQCFKVVNILRTSTLNHHQQLPAAHLAPAEEPSTETEADLSEFMCSDASQMPSSSSTVVVAHPPSSHCITATANSDASDLDDALPDHSKSEPPMDDEYDDFDQEPTMLSKEMFALSRGVNLATVVIERTGKVCYQCPHCEFRSDMTSRLLVHLDKVHSISRTFYCRLCGFHCKWNRQYYRHMRGHYKGPPFECDSCGYQTEAIQNLLIHLMKHSDERPFKCSECEYRGRTKSNLILHLRQHSAERNFECTICNKSFRNKCTLKQHLASHSTTRPFVCDQCSFSAKYQSHLTAHKRIHSGEVYRCSFDSCQYTTPRKTQMKYHMRTHAAQRGFVCSVCQRSFSDHAGLVRHCRTHSTAKQFSCPRCNYTSLRQDRLKQHLQSLHSPLNGTGVRDHAGEADAAKVDVDRMHEQEMVPDKTAASATASSANFSGQFQVAMQKYPQQNGGAGSFVPPAVPRNVNVSRSSNDGGGAKDACAYLNYLATSGDTITQSTSCDSIVGDMSSDMLTFNLDDGGGHQVHQADVMLSSQMVMDLRSETPELDALFRSGRDSPMSTSQSLLSDPLPCGSTPLAGNLQRPMSLPPFGSEANLSGFGQDLGMLGGYMAMF